MRGRTPILGGFDSAFFHIVLVGLTVLPFFSEGGGGRDGQRLPAIG